jgi:hypothetical protein
MGNGDNMGDWSKGPVGNGNNKGGHPRCCAACNPFFVKHGTVNITVIIKETKTHLMVSLVFLESTCDVDSNALLVSII